MISDDVSNAFNSAFKVSDVAYDSNDCGLSELDNGGMVCFDPIDDGEFIDDCGDNVDEDDDDNDDDGDWTVEKLFIAGKSTKCVDCEDILIGGSEGDDWKGTIISSFWFFLFDIWIVFSSCGCL